MPALLLNVLQDFRRSFRFKKRVDFFMDFGAHGVQGGGRAIGYRFGLILY